MIVNELMQVVRPDCSVWIVPMRQTFEDAPVKKCHGKDCNHLGKVGVLPIKFVAPSEDGYDSVLIIIADGYQLDDGEFERLQKQGGLYVDC